MDAANCRTLEVHSTSMKRRTRKGRGRALALAYLGGPRPTEIRLKHVVDQHIKRVLAATDGNLSVAAELLGINRRSLQRHARRKRKRARAKKRK